MEVMVVGMAGSPTYESCHNGELEEIEDITISRDENSKLCFERDYDSDYVINTNDYVIVYKSV